MRIFLCLALQTVDGTQAQQLNFEGQVHFFVGTGPPSQTKVLGKKRSTWGPGEEKKEVRILGLHS